MISKCFRRLFLAFVRIPSKVMQLLAGVKRTRKSKLVEPEGREYRGFSVLGSLLPLLFFIVAVFLTVPTALAQQLESTNFAIFNDELMVDSFD